MVLSLSHLGVTFSTSDARKLLTNKFVVIIGDSVHRCIYKDLVQLLQSNCLLKNSDLRAKGEYTFLGDCLIAGGRKSKEGLNNGIRYHEVRQYQTDFFLIRFYFVTRCYNAYVESIMKDLQMEPRPDLLIMNSCLWDITRYGTDAINTYKTNLEYAVHRFQQILPEHCLFIWNTTLPVSRNARGGFLVQEVTYCNSTLRLDILEANFFARIVMEKADYDVLDLHFYFRSLLQLRVHDGIHWCAEAHRRISNMLLSHISHAWGEPLPNTPSVFVPTSYSDFNLSVNSSFRYHITRTREHSTRAIHNNGCNLMPPISRTSASPNSSVASHVRKHQMHQSYSDLSDDRSTIDSYIPLHSHGLVERNANQFSWTPYSEEYISGCQRTSVRSSRQHYRCPW